MALFAALLLAQAPAALPPPAAPRTTVTATASAFAEVLRAERVGGVAAPDGLLRQYRRPPHGLIVDFN